MNKHLANWCGSFLAMTMVSACAGVPAQRTSDPGMARVAELQEFNARVLADYRAVAKIYEQQLSNHPYTRREVERRFKEIENQFQALAYNGDNVAFTTKWAMVMPASIQAFKDINDLVLKTTELGDVYAPKKK